VDDGGWDKHLLEGIVLSIAAIVNVVSFRRNPHVRSIFSKGVWGFTERNRKRWDLLESGVRVLFYGDKGIRLAGYIKNKYESREPVTEWIKNPTGYPLHITLDLVDRDVDKVNPIERSELASKYGVGLAKMGFRGFSLVIFGSRGTYPLNVFDEIWNEFLKRNGYGERFERKEEGGDIEEYVRYAQERIHKYNAKLWTEENTKAILVEPLLKALGWDIHSLEDVERGHPIPIGTKWIEVDYVLKVDGQPKAFLEAKALNNDLNQYVEQTISYAKIEGVNWAILTNERELRVYDATQKFQVFKLTLDEYVKEYDKLLLLSKEKMKEEQLSRLADEKYHRQTVLEWFMKNTDTLVGEIVKSNPKLKKEALEKVLKEILEKMKG